MIDSQSYFAGKIMATPRASTLKRTPTGHEEITRLNRELARAKAMLAAYEAAFGTGEELLRAILGKRGFQVLKNKPAKDLFLPQNPDQSPAFFPLMRRYSFRLFLREILWREDPVAPRELTRYCSLPTVKIYLNFLKECGLVKHGIEGWRLNRTPLPSFGPTLEYWVAQEFRREFQAPTLWNVRLKGVASGGDFDILSWLNGNLICLEVKSSPPRGIELPEVRGFVRRLRDLRPDAALFLVDTELRMKDKMVPLFEEVLSRENSFERLKGELFHLDHQLYILNSKRQIFTNIWTCLRDFERHQPRGISLRPKEGQ
jgi:hypothetical protein